MLDESKVIRNKDLIECIDTILYGLVEGMTKLHGKELIQTKTLVEKEYEKFIKRFISFYSKMHTSMQILKDDTIQPKNSLFMTIKDEHKK
jgi:uncharacterized protein YaaR (DUF327 family)